MDFRDYDAGNGQVIVVYVTDDTGEMIDSDGIWRQIAADSCERAAQGLRIVSTTGLPLRQMGTAGNVFFQSGGQFATLATITVVYAR